MESADGEELELRVYNYTGQEVYTRTDFQPGSILDLSDQRAGAYILRVSSSRGVGSILIQKL